MSARRNFRSPAADADDSINSETKMHAGALTVFVRSGCFIVKFLSWFEPFVISHHRKLISGPSIEIMRKICREVTRRMCVEAAERVQGGSELIESLAVGSIASKTSDLRSDDSLFVLPGKTIEDYRLRYGSGLQMKSSEYQIYDAATDIESVKSCLASPLVTKRSKCYESRYANRGEGR